MADLQAVIATLLVLPRLHVKVIEGQLDAARCRCLQQVDAQSKCTYKILGICFLSVQIFITLYHFHHHLN